MVLRCVTFGAVRDRSDEQRQGGSDITVDGQVELVLAELFEFEVLDVQDEVDYGGGGVVADADGDVALELGSDGIAVSVHDKDADHMIAGFDLRETDAGGNTAGPVSDGHFSGEE